MEYYKGRLYYLETLLLLLIRDSGLDRSRITEAIQPRTESTVDDEPDSTPDAYDSHDDVWTVVMRKHRKPARRHSRYRCPMFSETDSHFSEMQSAHLVRAFPSLGSKAHY